MAHLRNQQHKRHQSLATERTAAAIY
jgi:hypothetical protein